MSEEPIHPETPIRHAPKRKPRGIAPTVWIFVGVGLGIVGTAALSRPKPPKPQIVVLRPRVSKHAVSLPSAQDTGAAETLVAQRDQPANAIPPANPFGGSVSGSAFILPKLAGHAPVQPLPFGAPGTMPGLSGVILPKKFPAPPPAWTPPPAIPVSIPKLPMPNGKLPTPPPALPIPPNTGGASPSDKTLLATIPHDLPKPPEALAIPKETPKAATPAKGAATLVTVREIANDGSGTAEDFVAYAAKLGGNGQPLVEQGSDKKVATKGVLLAVPPAALDDLLKHIGDGNAITEKTSWSGSLKDRREKLVEDAQSRFASLKRLREVLLVTYLEDADPVQDVDEEIGKATRSLDQLRTDNSTDGMTIVRITFVPKD